MTQSAGMCSQDFLFFFKKIKKPKKKPLLVACAEVPISSIGTWKARHHRKRIRSRGSGDTPSLVIPLFTRKEYLFMLYMLVDSRRV
jgi:hypothetical protein